MTEPVLGWLRTHDVLDECGEVAVAIGEPRSGQRHAGIYYRGDDGVWLLHFAFHCDLRRSRPSPNYRWASIAAMDPTVAAFVATLCRQLGTHDGKELPYGFGRGRFDPERGIYEQASRARGLTCATFVLAVLAAYEIELVDVDTWEQRGEDTAWQEEIVSLIAQRHPEASEHIEAIRADVGNCVRVRPEEVAGAASIADLPVAFSVAALIGEQVLEALRM